MYLFSLNILSLFFLNIKRISFQLPKSDQGMFKLIANISFAFSRIA